MEWNGSCATVKRSEEHTSELQSPCNLVCRLLLEKKNESRVPTSGRCVPTVRVSVRGGTGALRHLVRAATARHQTIPHLQTHDLFRFFFFLMHRAPPRFPPFPSTPFFQ